MVKFINGLRQKDKFKVDGNIRGNNSKMCKFSLSMVIAVDDRKTFKHSHDDLLGQIMQIRYFISSSISVDCRVCNIFATIEQSININECTQLQVATE